MTMARKYLNEKEIRRRRQELDLTQEDVAALAGKKEHSLISKIETGQRDNITVETLVTIADILRCSADDLLHRAEPDDVSNLTKEIAVKVAGLPIDRQKAVLEFIVFQLTREDD